MTELIRTEFHLSRRTTEIAVSGLDKNGVVVTVGDPVAFEPEDSIGRIRDVIEGCIVRTIFVNRRVSIEHPSFVDSVGRSSTKTTSLKFVRKTR